MKKEKLADEQAENFFYENFLEGVTKIVLKCRHFKSPEMIETVRAFGNRLVRFFPEHIKKDNVSYGNTMRCIFDPDMAFFREFGNKQIEPVTLLVYAEEPQDWRKNLKKGDRIDVIKREKDGVNLSGWSSGRIQNISEGKVILSYDGLTEKEDRAVLDTSREFTVYGSYTGTSEWREELKAGDKVDCMDTAGVWYRSTVLDSRSFLEGKSTRNVVKILIAFREYREDGIKKDSEGKSYTGWGTNYDEWINNYSLRIQRSETMAKLGIMKCKKAEDNDDKLQINDTMDRLLNSAINKSSFAILRAEHSRNEYLVQFLNCFGKEGGFDMILSRLNDKTNVLCFELAYFYICIISLNWKAFHQKFALEFLPTFIQSVIEYCKAAPDSEVRKMQKTRFDNILKNLDVLLRRCYTTVDRYRILETFSLHMYIMMIKTGYLQRRIDGLKGMNEMIKSSTKGLLRHYSNQILADIIIKEKILDEIFGDQKHQQLVQRSAPILSLLYEVKLLSSDILDRVWELTKDSQIRVDVINALIETSLPFQSEELEYLVKKVESMDPTEICEEALDIIHSSSKTSGKSAEELLRFSEHMLAISQNEKHSKNIVEKAITKYSEMIHPLDCVPHKKNLLNRFLLNDLKKNEKSAIVAIKLICKIIMQFSSLVVPGTTNTKESIVEYLVIEKNIIPIVIENLQYYYEHSDNCGCFSHDNQINERLDFLTFLIENSCGKFKLQIEYIYLLWKILREFPKLPSDTQALFKFLQQIAVDKTSFSTNFNSEEVIKFFEEKMANPKQDFSNLSIDEFKCLLQYFTIINDLKDKIVVNYAQPQRNKSCTSASNGSGISYASFGVKARFSFSRKKQNTTSEITNKVDPNCLVGIEMMWKIPIEATDKEVFEKSRDVLNKLYAHITQERQEALPEIRASFITTYLEKLSALLDSEDSHRIFKIERLMELMVNMIDESERKGTGGLKSHSSLMKGELIHLILINNVSNDKEIPKKLEVSAYGHTTIWDLKVEIGKYFKCSAGCMQFNIGSNEIKDTENGRPLSEFTKEKSITLTVIKKNMNDIPLVPLLTPENTLTERAKICLSEIFVKFAKKDKMDSECLASFIKNTTGEKSEVPTNDPRIKMFLSSFDTDKDGCIDLEGFLEFYRDSLLNHREDRVRQNLLVHGFRNDLKKISEIEDSEIDTSTLPRYILSSNPKSFDLLYRVLEIGGRSTEHAYILINRLATSERILDRLQKLPMEGTEVAWTDLINIKSTYTLLYCLQILDSLVEEEDSSNTEEKGSSMKEWRNRFVELGGFDFLLDIFMNGTADTISFTNPQVMGKFEKECLYFLLKIIGSLLRNASFNVNKSLHEKYTTANEQFKKDFSIAENAKSQEDEKEQRENQQTEQANTEIDVHKLFTIKPSSVLFLKERREELQAKTLRNIIEIGDVQSQKILKKAIDYKLNLKVPEVLQNAIRQETLILEDEQVVSSSLSLFVTCVMIKSEWLLETLTSPGFDIALMECILCKHSEEIRNNCSSVLLLLSTFYKEEKEKTLFEFALKLFLDKYINGKEFNDKTSDSKLKESQIYCEKFFMIFEKLIEMSYDNGPTDSKLFEPKSLLFHTISKLKKHKSTETRASQTPDYLLIGLINIIRTVLTHEETLREECAVKEGLLAELFGKCLFPGVALASDTLPSLNSAESLEGFSWDAQKCKSKESRSAAYKLMATLCKGSHVCQLYHLKECLEPLCKSIIRHNGWGHIPSSESRSSYGYVGIENLGCICYMIAMIQQFFMIPTLRYSILNVDDQKPANPKPPLGVDDNVLHQFQRMFAHLEASERICYNPTQFCFAFKDQDGKPTNISIQQDAQEFLNLILDRLEFSLKHTPEKYLLQNIFGGKTCNRLICKGGCGNIRDNYEDFLNLSLGVKRNNTLYESLSKFVADEQISDFFCDKCNKKVNVVKRTCLSDLPNILIIHLQRLVFNYDTLTNDKINSRLEFPKELDLESYTVEGLEKKEDAELKEGMKCYKFKLVGVVVHIGTADLGHYISYINTSGLSEDPEKDVWLEYNDKHIRSFDICKLESECFGGGESKSSNFFLRSFESNMKNAYMLVYEKIRKTPVKKIILKKDISSSNEIFEYTTTKALSDPFNKTFHDKEKDEYFSFVDFFDFKKKLPSKLGKEVWDDNSNFLFEQQIYSQDFLRFVHIMLKYSAQQLPSMPEKEKQIFEISITQISLKIIYDVLAHAYHNLVIRSYIDYLIGLCAQSKTATNEFFNYVLEKDMKDTIIILTKCSDKDARNAVSRLLIEVILIQLNREGTEFMEYTIEKYETKEVYKYKTQVGQILYILISSINNSLASCWENFDQFFEVFLQICERGGDNMAIFMNDKRLIALLIDFYLGSESPLCKPSEKRTPMGMRYKIPNFVPLINVVCFLASRADLSVFRSEYKTFSGLFEMPKPLYTLDEEEKKCLMAHEFFKKTITENHSTPGFAKFVGIFSYQNEKFSKKLAKLILKGINEDPMQDFTPYFTVLKLFLALPDELKKQRIEWLFGIGTIVKEIPKTAKDTDNIDDRLKVGLGYIRSIQQKTFDYSSPLNYNTRYDSLLNLMWQYRKNLQIETIKCLLELILQSEIVLDYLINLPPPTYRYHRYTDWIRPLIENYPNMYSGFYSFSGAEIRKEEPSYKEAVELLKKFEIACEKKGVKKEPYLIGKLFDEKILKEEEKDGIKVIVSELHSDVFKSIPKGNNNEGIPEHYLPKKPIDSLQEEHSTLNLYEELAQTLISRFNSNRKYKQENEEDLTMHKEDKKTTQADPDTSEEGESSNPPEKKEVSNPEEKTVEEEKKIEFHPWLKCATLLKIEVHNQVKGTTKVKLNILPSEKEEGKSKVNFYIPESSLCCLVEGEKKFILLLIQKEDVQQEWGDFRIVWEMKHKCIQGERYINPHDQVMDLEEFGFSEEDSDEKDVECPSCQFYNPETAEVCSHCNKPLFY